MRARGPVWSVDLGGGDLGSAAFHGALSDQWEMWARARRAHSVAWTESEEVGGFWSVVGHEAASRVLKQPGLFPSGLGMRLGGESISVQAAAQRMLIVSDGSAHRRVRAKHTAWLNNRAAARVKDALWGELAERVDGLVAQERFDVATTLATELPAIIVCRILGVPRSDWAYLTKLTAVAFDDSAGSSASVLERQQASAEVFQYFYDLLEQRRFEPEDDIVSALSHPEEDDEPLSDDEILLNCDGLANGGLGTTRHAVSGMFHAFAQNPDQWQLLKQRPDLIDSAVDEVLRWTVPPTHVMRTAARDTQLAAADIRAGDRLVIWLPSCNRDETAFTDPARFDITRRPNPHLSFGAGPHYCVGAPIARAELRCLLEILLERVRDLEPTGDAAKLPSNFLNGYARLGVRVSGEAR